MKLGIFAKTFSGNDPETVLSAVTAAGYTATQYNMACSGLPAMPERIPQRVAERVAHAAARNRLEIAALSGTYNMIHPDPQVRRVGLAGLDVLAASAVRLDTGLITLCTGTRNRHDQWKEHPDNDSPEAWSDLLDSMQAAVEIADRYDVDLGIEPELANVINSAGKARRLIDEIASPRLKIVLDPANLFEIASPMRQRDIVAAAIDLLGDRIAMAHAKDRTQAGAFATAGTGVLDYPHYLSCLKQAGFTGCLITHGLAEDEAEAVAVFLRQALRDAGIESSR